MPQATICSHCRKLIPDGQLEAHRRAHTAARTRQRKATEPWRRIYSTQAWQRAREKTKKRDGHQCRAISNGCRCTGTTVLQVDHTTPLRDLYNQASSWPAFVLAATQPDTLITVCPHHHSLLENHRRRNA